MGDWFFGIWFVFFLLCEFFVFVIVFWFFDYLFVDEGVIVIGVVRLVVVLRLCGVLEWWWWWWLKLKVSFIVIKFCGGCGGCCCWRGVCKWELLWGCGDFGKGLLSFVRSWLRWCIWCFIGGRMWWFCLIFGVCIYGCGMWCCCWWCFFFLCCMSGWLVKDWY